MEFCNQQLMDMRIRTLKKQRKLLNSWSYQIFITILLFMNVNLHNPINSEDFTEDGKIPSEG